MCYEFRWVLSIAGSAGCIMQFFLEGLGSKLKASLHSRQHGRIARVSYFLWLVCVTARVYRPLEFDDLAPSIVKRSELAANTGKEFHREGNYFTPV
eukprot:3122913-Amphidinium_carterae.1